LKIRPSSSSVLGNPGSRTGVWHLVTLQLAFSYSVFFFFLFPTIFFPSGST
jgi:hypothetical protein